MYNIYMYYFQEVHWPANKYKKLPPEKTKPSAYPVALIPGQFQEYYKSWVLENLYLTSTQPKVAYMYIKLIKTEKLWLYYCSNVLQWLLWLNHYAMTVLTLLYHTMPYNNRNVLTLRTLVSTTVDILSWHLYNQLLKVKCAFNFETLILCWDLISARHNFRWLKIQIE